jgi:hypothetical protein
MIIQDGQRYNDNESVLDIGSWVAYKVSEKGNVREYVGLSIDVPKLPKYKYTERGEALGGGSTAICCDTSDVYIYNPSDDSWKQL